MVCDLHDAAVYNFAKVIATFSYSRFYEVQINYQTL